MRLTVFDGGRTGQNSVSVTVANLSHANQLAVTLSAVAGVPGMFTGTVATVVGSGPVSGILAMQNGDALRAQYVDILGVTRTTTATARLLPPVISGLNASVDLGLMTITWQTDEPANSVVLYGTNQPLTLATTNAPLTLSHTLRLYNLVPGKTYYFAVSSTDEAGNTASNNNSGAYFSFVAVQTPTVLLVDAYEQADGSQLIPDGAYTNALAASGFSFAFWKVTDRGGSPELADLKPFQAVIWRVTDDAINYTGTNNTLNASQQAMIENYINGGGSFLLSSMEILSRLGDVPFRKSVLQVQQFIVNSDPFGLPCGNCDEDFGVPAITGRAGSAISDGLDTPLDYTNYPYFDLGDSSYGPDFSDTFTPSTNATAVVFESTSGRVCGMAYPRPGLDTAGRVVFLSFPIDTLLANGSPPNNEASLLRNILNFLVPGVNGRGEISLDSPAYTAPDLVNVEVGDTDLTGTGQTQCQFTSTSSTNPLTVIVNETTHRGLFRGYITITTNAPGTNRLLVADGDVITARYFDASAGSNVSATAVVDLQPAVIGNVTAAPKYFDAIITWTTSKPADALVQFGESQLLGRTAYTATISTNHSVTLAGLVPNRNYYYQVVSRDNAGNTTVANNADNFYTFHTLLSQVPPWNDTLDTGAANWTVVGGDGNQVSWQLGVPQNGRETAAHSPPNAWGSNLKAQAIDYTDSYLFSPPIDLAQASDATLTFWHSYDFTSPDLIELGEVMVATNFTVEQAVTLNTYTNDATAGWTEESLNLKPYIGKTIMLVWHYSEFTFGGSTPPAGWLVDDISVTASNRTTGTLVITNNLWQSQCTLSGPTNYFGAGASTVISNAPPGQYVITYAAVPYYQTPSAQTNNLAVGVTVTFAGNYTFADANSNGIPDAWEMQTFGNVTTNRTQSTDTDGDGMSDYSEFIAGTDPKNAASVFEVAATPQNGNQWELDWMAALGHGYRILSSTNVISWQPYTDWIVADHTNMTWQLPAPDQHGPSLFRLEVRP
jgi:hypothetical protein